MQDSRNKRVIIVGGGIGGLVTALALQRAGIKTLVFERASVMREIGAGLVLVGNAVKILERLGLGQVLKKIATPITHSGIRSWRGNVLANTALEPLMQKYQTQALAVHRVELQSALLGMLDEGVLCTGAKCTGFVQDQNGVRAHFADGQQIGAHVLVGADGLNSVIRKQLFGSAPPEYAGYTAWRGVAHNAQRQHALECSAVTEIWGNGQRFGTVPLSHGRTYWWATLNMPEDAIHHEIEHKPMLLQRYSNWHAPIPALIAETDENVILRNNIYDRNPLPYWSLERVTLLGDAAHPMTPNLGQGACQAIEDAFTLAICLRDTEHVVDALHAYEQRRMQRAYKIMLQSRKIGQIAQMQLPRGERVRNLLIKLTPTRVMQRQLAWALDEDV